MFYSLRVCISKLVTYQVIGYTPPKISELPEPYTIPDIVNFWSKILSGWVSWSLSNSKVTSSGVKYMVSR